MLKSRDIDKLRGDVAANCHKFVALCKAAGLNVLVTETVRDNEYQASLYAKGRTAPGSIVTNAKTPTFHSVKAGLAFDICKNVRGHEYDDNGFFTKCAAIGKQVGFSWGGDWKSFVDKPHFQWDNHGKATDAMIRKGQYPPAMPRYGGPGAKDPSPAAKPPAAAAGTKNLYTVKVTADALNVRSGPGISFPVKQVIRDHGVYGIVEERGSWGKLKSGAGWISLNYTKIV